MSSCASSQDLTKVGQKGGCNVDVVLTKSIVVTIFSIITECIHLFDQLRTIAQLQLQVQSEVHSQENRYLGADRIFAAQLWGDWISFPTHEYSPSLERWASKTWGLSSLIPKKNILIKNNTTTIWVSTFFKIAPAFFAHERCSILARNLPYANHKWAINSTCKLSTKKVSVSLANISGLIWING